MALTEKEDRSCCCQEKGDTNCNPGSAGSAPPPREGCICFPIIRIPSETSPARKRTLDLQLNRLLNRKNTDKNMKQPRSKSILYNLVVVAKTSKPKVSIHTVIQISNDST